MSADAKPAGYETKSVPGYVPATVPTADHPGPYFEGQDGYSNTPGVSDPESSGSPAGGSGSTSKAGKSTAKTSDKS